MQTELLESAFLLSGQRVELRGFGDKELYSKEYLQWCNDFDVIKKIGRDDYNLPVTRKMLVEYVNGLPYGRATMFAIYFKETKEPRFVGTLKLYDIDMVSRRASIGIMVGDREAWGKGIGTEAINLIVNHVFTRLHFHKVTAGYQSENAAMAKSFERAEFVKEGILKNHTYTDGAFQDIVLVARFKDANDRNN